MKKTIMIFLLLLCISIVHAASGHITLLTVSDEEAHTGGTADLYLKMQPGEGAVYIDSFPLTRVDTQSSVRYANQIACDLLQKDCSQYDFFYTIRANSAIVGGPSAGAAITVLTVAMLDGQTLDQHTAMTGTINSGGIIGPVAGIDAKVKGARQAGITKVLIPSITSDPDIYMNASNTTALVNTTVTQEPLKSGRVDSLSDNQTVVIRAGTVEDALYEFTGKNYSQPLQPLVEPTEYRTRMANIMTDICNRTITLDKQRLQKNLVYNDTHNYTQRIAQLPGSHAYAKASLCFSQNIELATILEANVTPEQRTTLYRNLRQSAKDLDKKVRSINITTISDLETYAIVKERIIEAQQILDGDGAQEPRNLAYAQERLVSAKSWSIFFGMQGKKVELNNEYLQRACQAKLAEADERINYVRIYAPKIVSESEDMLNDAQGYSTYEPILCIFTASKAKAQANVLANAISVGEENVDALLQQKLDADRTILQKQQEKGFFPLLGYSYTQYAADLRKPMPYSSLIFSEYALELSNLDIYFPKEKHWRIPPGIANSAMLFALGTAFGIGVSIVILSRTPKKKKRR